jgi:hypothetical protein
VADQEDLELYKLVRGLSKAQKRQLGSARVTSRSYRMKRPSRSLHALGLTMGATSTILSTRGLQAVGLLRELPK